MDILDELKKLINRLNEEEIEYALCGGLAMAFYALPRTTLDIDILIEASSLDTTRRAVHDLGFTLKAAPREFHGGKVHIHGNPLLPLSPRPSSPVVNNQIPLSRY